MLMKILSDYMTATTLFPRMGIAALSDTVASQLDSLLKVDYGLRTLAPIVLSFLETDGTVTEAEANIIAGMVYALNKEKWDSLIKFQTDEYDPMITNSRSQVKTYGKKEANANTGSDTTTNAQGIFGFDSTEAVNDTNGNKTVQYGKTATKTDSGSDTTTVSSRNEAPSQLEEYDLRFWQEHGLLRTILCDTAQTITLPIYDIDDIT